MADPNISKNLADQLKDFFATEPIEDLEEGLTHMADATQELTNEIKKLRGQKESELEQGTERRRRGIRANALRHTANLSRWRLGYELGRANIFVGILINTVRQAVAEGSKLHVRGLAMGFSLSDLIGDNIESLQRVPGSIVDALGSRMELLEHGLDANSMSLVRAGVFMKTLGGDKKRAN